MPISTSVNPIVRDGVGDVHVVVVVGVAEGGTGGPVSTSASGIVGASASVGGSIASSMGEVVSALAGRSMVGSVVVDGLGVGAKTTGRGVGIVAMAGDGVVGASTTGRGVATAVFPFAVVINQLHRL